MRTVRFELLRPDEILAERGRCPVVYQPIGPLEWHGPHLPMGTDPLHAEAVARRAAEIGGGVVMPTLFWGTERERRPAMLRQIGFESGEWIVGMDFPANTVQSLYSPEDIFGVVVRARLDGLVRQGYRLIVIVNGHGAENHVAVLERLAAEYTAASPVQVLSLLAFKPEDSGEFRVGHADALETSLMMALHPESVDLSGLPALPAPLENTRWAVVDAETFAGHPTGDHTVAPHNDPRSASSAEQGAAHLDDTVSWIAGQVRAALAALEDSAR
jgi:creatinine amidohydrolase